MIKFKLISIARDFNKMLKAVDAITPQVARYNVKITEDQIGILKYCAFIGIKNSHDLKCLLQQKSSVKTEQHKHQVGRV